MESYGAILRSKREEKGLDLDSVSRDTAIASSFLKALENEDTSVFPGEPYLVGFLRNYADYLGVDSAKVIQLYHSKTLQESPVPEGLIVRERPKFLIPLIIVLAVLLVAAGTVFCVYTLRRNIEEKEAAVALEKSSQGKRYELLEKPMQTRLYKGDQLVLRTAEGEVVITVAGTVGNLALETPAGVQRIELSEEIELDIDGDSLPDMIVYVSDVSSEENDRGAEARILVKSGTSSSLGETKLSDIPNAEDLPQGQNRTVVFEDTRAYPFTLRADFRGGCVFRYRLDRKETVEDYFTSGDTVNMTASNGIRLWISNGSTVKLQVLAASKTYDLGIAKAGQVVVQDVRWIKDTDGKYKLVINELD